MKKKRQAPQHVHKNEGNHPCPNLSLIHILESVEDPRGASCNFLHPLTSILFTTIVCTLCGADDWEAIVVQANLPSMKVWLSKYVDMSNGVPSVKTFKRVFSCLNPAELNNALTAVASQLNTKTTPGVYSFDGKTMRGTASPQRDLKAIHMLNAWSHELGICVGHIKVDEKTNEITALPKLMDLLDLKGAIITADALNTQKEAATKAIDLGADYFFPVKGNHPSLLEEITLLFSEAQEKNFVGMDGDNFETVEKSHGRVEERKYFSLDGSELPSAEEWKGLQSIGMVVRERTEKGKSTKEIHYYISSCEINAQLLAKVTRGHWGIENSLHWVLDVIFREDKLRYRDKIGAQNLASVRKIVLASLSQDDALKCGKAGKRLAAATDEKYRESLLKYLF